MKRSCSEATAGEEVKTIVSSNQSGNESSKRLQHSSAIADDKPSVSEDAVLKSEADLLPVELWQVILLQLCVEDAMRARLVSRRFASLANQPTVCEIAFS